MTSASGTAQSVISGVAVVGFYGFTIWRVIFFFLQQGYGAIGRKRT
jgi:hypothetical protein